MITPFVIPVIIDIPKMSLSLIHRNAIALSIAINALNKVSVG